MVKVLKNKDVELKVIGDPELEMSIKNLELALAESNFSKYGWSLLKNYLKGHKFEDNNDKKHFLGQVRLMLKLWGTGPDGKNTIAAIVNKCLGNNDKLENIGNYVLGTEIKNTEGKKIGEVKPINPVVLWINDYRKKNNLGNESVEITNEKEPGKKEIVAKKIILPPIDEQKVPEEKSEEEEQSPSVEVEEEVPKEKSKEDQQTEEKAENRINDIDKLKTEFEKYKRNPFMRLVTFGIMDKYKKLSIEDVGTLMVNMKPSISEETYNEITTKLSELFDGNYEQKISADVFIKKLDELKQQ